MIDSVLVDSQLNESVVQDVFLQERFRVPEVLFQPHLAGVDQAGLDEICHLILSGLKIEERGKVLENVFLTGGHTLYPSLATRLHHSLSSNQPVNARICVKRAQDARLDPWRGMAKWSLQDEGSHLKKASVTREEYLEFGNEYGKDHELGSNKFL